MRSTSTVMTLALLAVASAVATTVVAAAAAVTDAPPCGIAGFNLTGLTSSDLSTSLGNDKYFLHVCGPMESSPACSGEGGGAASACWFSQLNFLDVGDYSSAQWNVTTDSNGNPSPQYSMQSMDGSNKCLGTPFKSVVTFECNMRPPPQASSMSVAKKSLCTIEYTIQTPLACNSNNALMQQAEKKKKSHRSSAAGEVRRRRHRRTTPSPNNKKQNHHRGE